MLSIPPARAPWNTGIAGAEHGQDALIAWPISSISTNRARRRDAGLHDAERLTGRWPGNDVGATGALGQLWSRSKRTATRKHTAGSVRAYLCSVPVEGTLRTDLTILASQEKELRELPPEERYLAALKRLGMIEPEVYYPSKVFKLRRMRKDMTEEEMRFYAMAYERMIRIKLRTMSGNAEVI
ncbi:hypothetical protein AYO40_03440 [Planctomycetaceae bacterium SCGC AG-212-D15]|nr:hypothetical protein AYO40_03440 [Planctomycetaceae bacterium SCGC AG-212-D15]